MSSPPVVRMRQAQWSLAIVAVCLPVLALASTVSFELECPSTRCLRREVQLPHVVRVVLKRKGFVYWEGDWVCCVCECVHMCAIGASHSIQ